MHNNILCAGITLHPENQMNATGQTIELTCDVYGTNIANDLVYQWRNDQSGWISVPEPVAVNGSNVLSITNASVTDNGLYNCVIFSTDNNSTVAKSNSASVTILGTLCVCYISYSYYSILYLYKLTISLSKLTFRSLMQLYINVFN